MQAVSRVLRSDWVEAGAAVSCRKGLAALISCRVGVIGKCCCCHNCEAIQQILLGNQLWNLSNADVKQLVVAVMQLGPSERTADDHNHLLEPKFPPRSNMLCTFCSKA